jgi:hypothetical protein
VIDEQSSFPVANRQTSSVSGSKVNRNHSHHQLTKKHFPLASEGAEELQESSWPAQN